MSRVLGNQPPVDHYADRALLVAELSEARADSRTEALSEHVFGLVYRQMASLAARSGRDLDDLVQVACEQVLRSLPSFEGRAALSTWTYRICYATMLKHDRTRSRWLRRFTLSRTGELPEAADSTPGAPERIEAVERIVRLRSAVASLPPKRRAVVVLHDLEGLDVGQVSSIVGAKVGTVRSRLRDGRRQLARLLAADPYFGAVDLAERGPR